jgi:hypothetical protein
MAMSERDSCTGSESRSVAWWPVHEFMAALLAQANQLPVAGTPSWCALSDGDPRKLLAVAAAGEHHVLRVEIAQEAYAEASKAVAASTDWSSVANEIQQRASAAAAGIRIERVA